MATWNPMSRFGSEASFQLTLIFTVKCIIRLTVRCQLYRNGILPFLLIPNKIQIILAGIKKIKTIWRILHPIRITISIRWFFIKLLQCFRMNIVRIKSTVKINTNRFVILHESERQIWICRRIGFLGIYCNFTQ